MTQAAYCDAKVTTADSTNSVKEYFDILFRGFEQFEAAGLCTRISLQYGTGGTGTDYWDEADPFGDNCFVVYDFDQATYPFEVLIQKGDYSTGFGDAPGDPGKLRGNGTQYGVGIAMAAREDGGRAWAGETDNDGTDRKCAGGTGGSNPVWTAGASTLHVLDYSTASGGSYNTNFENLVQLGDMLPPGISRISMAATEEGFVILTDQGDIGRYAITMGGIYVPRTGLTPALPLFLIGNYPGTPARLSEYTDIYGTLTGNHTSREGGVIGRAGDGILPCAFAYDLDTLFNATLQPNQQPTTQELDAIAPYVICGHATRLGNVGVIQPDLLRMVYNVPGNTTNGAPADESYAYFGSDGATAGSWKYAIKWDGGLAPGNNSTRDGRTYP